MEHDQTVSTCCCPAPGGTGDSSHDLTPNEILAQTSGSSNCQEISRVPL